MIQKRFALVCGWIGLGILTAALSSGSALAERGSPFGPNFLSAQDVAFAQKTLEKDGYLKAGTYKEGERDQPTIDGLRKFQRAHFLRPSGQLDQDTMGMLTSHWRKGDSMLTTSGALEPSAAEYGPGGQGAGSRGPANDASGPPSGGPTRVARMMPQTGSPFAVQMAMGALLALVGGALLFKKARRSA